MLEALGKLQEQVKNVRLQEKTGERIFHKDALETFEPNTNRVKDTSQQSLEASNPTI